jgi:hypothetical protein
MLQAVRRTTRASSRRLIGYAFHMTELRPCSGCRRHIDANERVCPFCGVFGRLSRAGALASIALATAACGGTKPKSEPPPVENQQQQSTTATIDAGTEPTFPEEPTEDPLERRRRHRDNQGNPKMPYGAPPRARRIV